MSYEYSDRPNRDYTPSAYYAQPGPFPQPPKKRGHKALKIIALCLVMLFLGGVTTAAGIIFSGWFSDYNAITGAAAESQDTESGSLNADSSPGEKISLPALKTFSKDSEAMSASEIYSKYVESVVAIKTESTYANIFGQSSTYASSGTGFIISEDGYILTNNHVVEDASIVTVTLFSGESYTARVVGADSQNDIAVVHIEATALKPVNLGDSDDIIVGEDVAVIGNPLGELTNTLTTGIVSAVDRMINIDGTPISMFQIDAAVNSGNSGGPVFDSTGRVVGIVSAKSAGTSVEGLGFAIPINDALAVAKELVEHGYVTGRPYIGITVQTISATTAAYYDVPQGALVASVGAGSPAEKAGMQKSDIITMFGDTEVKSVVDLTTAKNKYSPGDKVDVKVYRGNGYLTLTLTLGEAGAENGTSAGSVPSQQFPVPSFDFGFGGGNAF
ncbi:MAG: S1C family serine protease [Oscillospiraceae bacterium]|jgi:serine protease Do